MDNSSQQNGPLPGSLTTSEIASSKPKSKLPWIILGVVIAFTSIIGSYYLGRQSINTVRQSDALLPTVQPSMPLISISQASPTASRSSSLDQTQIYQEVAAQLNLTRSKIVYFRIFSPDKVQYSNGSGATFAYKQNDKWTIAQEGAQGVANCSDFINVPELYRPPCYDETTKTNKYVESNGQMVNYPSSQSTSYIGD